MKHSQFLGYEDEDFAKRVLVRFHERGMEGDLMKLTDKSEDDPGPPVYAIQVEWPEGWSEAEIDRFVSHEIHGHTGSPREYYCIG